jgi:hypothetical protein
MTVYPSVRRGEGRRGPLASWVTCVNTGIFRHSLILSYRRGAVECDYVRQSWEEADRIHRVHAARNSSVIGTRSAMEDLSGTQDARRKCISVVFAVLGHLSSHHQRDDEGQDGYLLGCEAAPRRQNTRRESQRSLPGLEGLRVSVFSCWC